MVEGTIVKVTLRLDTAMIDADPRVVGQQRVCALILVDYVVDLGSTRNVVLGRSGFRAARSFITWML